MTTHIRQGKSDGRYAQKSLQLRMTDDNKLEFGRRLQAALIRKGWNQVDLARNASLKIPDNVDAKGRPKRSIGRDLIGLYCRGSSFPNPTYLQAIADALGMTLEQLVPASALAPADDSLTPFSVKYIDATRMHIRLNRTV